MVFIKCNGRQILIHLPYYLQFDKIRNKKSLPKLKGKGHSRFKNQQKCHFGNAYVALCVLYFIKHRKC
jgi:hypothetical protein